MNPADPHTWQNYYFAEPDLPSTKICFAKNETGQKSLHRAKLLDRLAALVPHENVTFSKRLRSVTEEANGRVTMTFEDGGVASADCAIGADGLHSRTRRYLFVNNESDWGHYEPKFINIVAYRVLIPMSKARAVRGDEIALSSVAIIARKNTSVSYPIDFGKTFNLVLCDTDVPQIESMHPAAADFAHIKKVCASWNAETQKIVHLLDNPKTLSWPVFGMPRLPTYVRSHVCIMGDAAHAMSPFIGAGAGQAIEDAYVLQTLFTQVKTVKDVGPALKAFDLTRRPRSHRIMTISRQTGDIYALRDPGYGEDVEMMRTFLPTRLEPVWDIDVEAVAEEARTHFRQQQMK